MPDPQFPTPNIRDLNLQAGNPVAFADVSRKTAGDIATGFSSTLEQIMQLLRQAQAQARAQGYGATQQQALQGANLPSSLIGASPSQQSNVLGAQASALQPAISGANTTFSDIGDIITNVRTLQQQREQQKNDLYKRIHDQFVQFGSASFAGYPPETLNELEREAGMPKGSIGLMQGQLSLKEKQMQSQQDKSVIQQQQFQERLQQQQQQFEERMKLAEKRAANVSINQPTEDEVIDTAQQLIAGNIVPSMLSKRTASYYKILAKADSLSKELTGKPYNAKQEEINFNAAKKFAASLNSQQMVRFQGLAGSVVNAIDEVRRLSGLVQNIGITPLNKIKLSAYVNVAGNTEQGQTVAQYLGAVNTLREEFANLAQGGYAPTEATWGLANRQINENYGVKQLDASLTEIQKLINYRMNAFTNLQPIIPGGEGQTQYGSAIRVRGPKGRFTITADQLPTFQQHGYVQE